MKGFYFSLDALLASSILLGTVMMLIAFPVDKKVERDGPRLDIIETSVMQPADRWNSSINSSETVLKYMSREYHEGEKTEAEKTCRSYFSTGERYAVYLTNSSDRIKLCGNYTVGRKDDLASKSVIAPAVHVNETLVSSRNAVMVIQD